MCVLAALVCEVTGKAKRSFIHKHIERQKRGSFQNLWLLLWCVCVCTVWCGVSGLEVRGQPISTLQEARTTTDPEMERKRVETFYKPLLYDYSAHFLQLSWGF